METKDLVARLSGIISVNLLGKIWSLTKLALVLIALVVLGSWLPELTPGFISDHFNKGEGGIVIVDSPEVYSRERLINDRFRQVSWLEDELKVSPKLQFGNQAISDLHQIIGMETRVGNTTGGEGGENPVAKQAEPKAGDRKKDASASVSPSERFRDIRAYREEIRTEMMETLLDDRHDIKGNTLYRLKFDTTVLPEENTSKLVIIQVKLARAEFCKPGTTTYPNRISDASHTPCINIKAIHDSWLQQTEVKINEAIEGTIRSLKRRSLTTTEFAELVRFLQSKAPAEIDRSDFKSRNIHFWGSLPRFYSQCVNEAKARFPSMHSPDSNGKDVWEKKILSCPRGPESNFYPVNRDPRSGARDSQLSARYGKLRQLLLRFYDEKLSHTTAHAEFESLHRRLSKKDRTDFQYRPQTQRTYFQAMSEITNAEIAEQILLRYAVVAMWIDKYTYSNEERIEQCKKLYDDKLEVFDPKSLSCIAHLEKNTCKDVSYCTVRVEARIPQPRLAVICDDKVKIGDLYEWCQVRRVFERLLKINETYYSYAVTPKESAQRVLTIASERRQKQLALSLLASPASGLDAEAVESITKAISESTTQLEQIQRKPLILSFGRGQPVVINDDMGTYQGIDFGWIIGPKYLFSSKREGKVRFYHAPTQNSLSAVISVPSWWTAMNLEIDTCWIDHTEIPNLKRSMVNGLDPLAQQRYISDLCDPEYAGSSHNVDVDYLIRLPGSTEELPRKFGYEIERVPAITTSGILADFYVGQPDASLIIQGHELWRSTVVTLGHQKADSIEVLPNMKGIIATFSKVDIPGQKIEPGQNRADGSGNCFIMSEVVVWTSEGRTPEQQLFARIHANPLLSTDPNSESAENRPQGFGACADPEKGPGQQKTDMKIAIPSQTS